METNTGLRSLWPLAGGIYDRSDVERAMELGVDAVQVATRFVTTEECDAPLAYKEAYINAKKEDIVITKSPVGMPGRAIMNPFLENVGKTPFKLEWCYQCLEHCDRKTIPYCITKALIDAAEGDVENSCSSAAATPTGGEDRDCPGCDEGAVRGVRPRRL